jgi:transposase
MKPSKETLLPYVHNRKEAAEKFGVSCKTILRWLKSYNIYEHGHYGRGKLNQEKAREIRQKYDEGMAIKNLAQEYKVTFATISRVIHRITYREPSLDQANVSVVYNPH